MKDSFNESILVVVVGPVDMWISVLQPPYLLQIWLYNRTDSAEHFFCLWINSVDNLWIPVDNLKQKMDGARLSHPSSSEGRIAIAGRRVSRPRRIFNEAMIARRDRR